MRAITVPSKALQILGTILLSYGIFFQSSWLSGFKTTPQHMHAPLS